MYDMTLKTETSFYYFVYGSCMCPIDLQRSMGEDMYQYLVGKGTLKGYRLRFSRFSLNRQCGVLDVVPDAQEFVEGVLYNLPQRLSDHLDRREGVSLKGYRRETITIISQTQVYKPVRTYVVVNKLNQEVAPNDTYSDTVLRGAISCGLSREYCQQLLSHMTQLQSKIG